jgi:hypothetical protein
MQAATWLIELGVGLACLAGGVVVFRGRRMRVVGVLLVVAGVAAAGHAIVRLSGN